jgi:hypothetical protein
MLVGEDEDGQPFALTVNVVAELQARLQSVLCLVGERPNLEFTVWPLRRCPQCEGPAKGYEMRVEVERQIIVGSGSMSRVLRCAQCGLVE